MVVDKGLEIFGNVVKELLTSSITIVWYLLKSFFMCISLKIILELITQVASLAVTGAKCAARNYAASKLSKNGVVA